jgi:hypothetical protein
MHIPLQSAPYGSGIMSDLLGHAHPSQLATAEAEHDARAAAAPHDLVPSGRLSGLLMDAGTRLSSGQHNQLHALLATGDVSEAVKMLRPRSEA